MSQLMTTKPKEEEVDVLKTMGKGYGKFWNSRVRWIPLKGGRGSKKSKTVVLRYIHNIMKYPGSNLLVIRRHFNTHKDSTFADLKWAANQMQVMHLWRFTVSPLEATYRPTGQKILFRGLDDPLKITSITVEKGTICWHWWEEVFEVEEAQDFDTVEETLRGIVEPPLWKETVLSYNPWIVSHWTKDRYWGPECPPNTLRLTTTHKCNEFLDQADHDAIEALAITNPERYKVVGLGEYGIPGGNFFTEFRTDVHVVPYKDPQPDEDVYVSIDYGLDMLAGLWMAINRQGDMRVFNETNVPGLVVSAATKQLKKINGDCNPIYWYAPPDLWASNAETGRNQAEAFFDYGKGLMLTMSKNAMVQGCSAVAEWLHPYEYTDPIDEKVKTRSRLTICDNCRELINHISQIKADESKPNEYDKDPHYLTHNCDSLRYALVMRTYPPVPPLAKATLYSFDKGIDRRSEGSSLYD